MNGKPNLVTKLTAFSLALFVAQSLGCGGPKPPAIKTYNTTGTVTYKDGSPASKCIIQFAPESDPGLNISAISEDDGSFELITLHENDNLPGAVAGPCRVTITLPIVTPIPKTLTLKEKYEISEDDNHFEIKLAVPPQG